MYDKFKELRWKVFIDLTRILPVTTVASVQKKIQVCGWIFNSLLLFLCGNLITRTSSVFFDLLLHETLKNSQNMWNIPPHCRIYMQLCMMWFTLHKCIYRKSYMCVCVFEDILVSTLLWYLNWSHQVIFSCLRLAAQSFHVYFEYLILRCEPLLMLLEPWTLPKTSRWTADGADRGSWKLSRNKHRIMLRSTYHRFI